MIDIGNRRECFFDDYLIDPDKTTAEQRLHKPERRGVLLNFDKPWEGNLVHFLSIIYAEGKWRMYYNCRPNGSDGEPHRIAYAESTDGQHFERPDLGIVEYNGSKHNNIILNTEMLKKFDFTGFDNFSVFYDDNPNCPSDEKYKMVSWWLGHAALVCLASADGIHFDKKIFITDDGEFDSQNRAFWSSAHGKYFCYYRGEHEPGEDISLIDRSYTDKVANKLFDPEKFLLRDPGAGTFSFMRDVRVIESTDFANWTNQRRIEYDGADLQMYTNCVFPYPRAPHLLVGLPLRYTERKAWTKNYDELCGREDRLNRMKSMARLGLAITDSLFMCSRDGYTFKKYDEALLSPPPENPEAFVYGDAQATPALIEVPSDIPGADNEYMIHVREGFRSARAPARLVKYAIRLDGFVSLHAGGEMRVAETKEFTYNGKALYANLSTSARGSVYFTIRHGDEEYTSEEIFGNSTNKRIHFEDDEAVARLSGKPVILTVRLLDADLYSIKFE